MMHPWLCKWAVLQLAEQMTSVDVVRNRCGASCMADVLPKLVVNVLSWKTTCSVGETRADMCLTQSPRGQEPFLIVRLSRSSFTAVTADKVGYLNVSHAALWCRCILNLKCVKQGRAFSADRLSAQLRLVEVCVWNVVEHWMRKILPTAQFGSSSLFPPRNSF